MHLDPVLKSFHEELQKIAVSEKWISSKIHSGLSKLEPMESLKRARKFSNSMQRLSDKSMERVDGTLDLKKFKKALANSERAERAAGYAWKADSALHNKKASVEKLAGFSRIGRRPMKVSTLLKKKPKATKMVKMSNAIETVAKGGKEVKKAIEGTHAAALANKYKVPLIAGGSIVAYDQLRKAKRDWETGRAMRLQSGY